MKKRIISALLAVCLLVSLGTVGVFADGAQNEAPSAEYVGSITVEDKTENYSDADSFVKAINEATSGAVVTLLKDIEVDVDAPADTSAAIVIDVNMTFNGNGRTIKAKSTGTTDTGAHVLSVEGSVTAEISNLIIDGASVAHHGIHVFGGAKADLKNVTIGGHYAYGLVVNNGASVEADKLIVNAGAANAWGSVNVDAKSTKAEIKLTNSNLTGDFVFDSAEGGQNTATLDNVAADTIKTNNDKADGTPQSSGNTTITISDSGVDRISFNGHGVDKVTINNESEIGLIESNNVNPANPTVVINDSTVKQPIDSTKIDYSANNSEVGGKPENDAEARIGEKYYDTLKQALEAATDGQTVELLKDITIDLKGIDKNAGYFVINKGLTIEGHNNMITASSTVDGKGQAHVIVVSNGNVTIQNLDIDGGNQVAHYGIQAVGANTTVNLKNIYVFNCNAYGAFANRGATVVADGLNTKGSGWGGVNVDTNGGNSKFVMNSGTLAEEYSVVIENSTGASATTTTTLNNGTFNKIQVKTGSGETNNLTINGGRYTDIVGDTKSSDGPVKSQTKVTAGTFDNPVDDVAQTPNYRVDRTNGTHNYYNTIEQAMNNANPGDDIEFLGSSRTYEVEFVYSKSYSSTVEVIEDDYIELPGGKYDGKVITGWTRGSVTYDVGDDVRVDRNMTFYVVLKDGEFDITIDSKIKHGTITTNVNSADRGDVVRIYVDPDTGYVLDELKVYTGTNYRTSVKVTYVNDSTYRFTMPGDDVYITATFKANGMPFVDVHRTQWFYDSIYYVWSNDMMEGDSATTFNPDGTMTRAMFWAVLGRMDGQTITGTNWVEQARNWAMREGVSDGTNPNDYVTREQMVTMLWRYAGEKNGSANLNRYTDSGSVSGYAVEAMRWAIGNGVIQGVTSTTLAPKANATRAECATIFMRFDKM